MDQDPNMADDDVHITTLDWTIQNPFTPWRRLEAFFYDVTSEPIKWKACISPLGRGINSWSFSFSLELKDIFDEERVARDVWVDISLNLERIETKHCTNFVFLPRRGFAFRFRTTAVVPPRLEHDVLTVNIRLRLPGRVPRHSHHFMDHESDTTGLSDDLYSLVSNPIYTDMRLRSNNDNDGNDGNDDDNDDGDGGNDNNDNDGNDNNDGKDNDGNDGNDNDGNDNDGNDNDGNDNDGNDNNDNDGNDNDGNDNNDENFEEFKVHSYIIRARWSNFFKTHYFDRAQRNPSFQINVSSNVLRDILTYLYSGRLNEGWPDWGNISYVNQLFHVIYSYNINHFYRVLFTSYEHQNRVTTRNVMSFELSADRQQLLDLPRNQGVNTHIQHLDYDMFLEYQVTHEYGPWLTCILRSRSQRRIRVQYNLVVKRIIAYEITPGNQIYRENVSSALDMELILHPHATINCSRVLFLACPQTFGNLPEDGGGLPREVRYVIRSIVKFNVGSESVQITTPHNERQNSRCRFSILCDHMQNLIIDPLESDLKIIEPETNTIYRTFKAMFAVRIPNWREVCGDILTPDMPDEVILPTLTEAIPFILSYICTGRSAFIPGHLFDEIEDFANRGNSRTLQDRIVRARATYMLYFNQYFRVFS